MHARFVLPVAAVGLALIAPGQLAAQGSPSTQVRPAQGAETSQCDDLLQQVQARMNTALAVNVRGAAADVRHAEELCNSGHPEQGMAILHRVRSSMNNN
jgi:hypothetical protein